MLVHLKTFWFKRLKETIDRGQRVRKRLNRLCSKRVLFFTNLVSQILLTTLSSRSSYRPQDVLIRKPFKENNLIKLIRRVPECLQFRGFWSFETARLRPFEIPVVNQIKIQKWHLKFSFWSSFLTSDQCKFRAEILISKFAVLFRSFHSDSEIFSGRVNEFA